MRRVVILGATGSIGKSSLDVIARHPRRFAVHALTAQSNVEALADLCIGYSPGVAVIADPARESALREALARRGCATQARSGAAALAEAAADPAADTVIAAIVGAAGLLPTLAAARSGKRVLLANKEALVCAGPLLMEALRFGAELLPVDSEHSALHQCLAGSGLAGSANNGVRRLILTASGGPFRTRHDLSSVTPDEACAHPNWVMGRKISVDSATLMNKGLEVIEASFLFGVDVGRIDVVVHPQSVVHSMVEFADASIVAQCGTPDMRTPIAYALAYPERIESGSAALDFAALGALTFEPPDLARFRCLALAYEALREGGGVPATLNAANEIAVEAFLAHRLPFDRIGAVIEETLQAAHPRAPTHIDDVIELDRRGRDLARAIVARGAPAQFTGTAT
jgi:1-deoxy-D-xylulose-5-phosphate reductoisomerase